MILEENILLKTSFCNESKLQIQEQKKKIEKVFKKFTIFLKSFSCQDFNMLKCHCLKADD